jgi:hypothetical protein
MEEAVSFQAIERPRVPKANGIAGISVGFGVFAAAILLAGSGCTATFTPEPVTVTYREPVVEAQAVPVDIYTYPRVFYGGTYVYLVDGRWYAPSPRGWVVYRQEPRELNRYRVRIQSSPRYQQRAPVYAAPREEGRERRPR